MHDLEIGRSQIFTDEAQWAQDHPSKIFDWVKKSHSRLIQAVESEWDEDRLIETLKFLKIRSTAFSVRGQFTREEILQSAYDFIYHYFWRQIGIDLGTKGRILKFFSRFLRIGLGRPYFSEDGSVYFSVNAIPQCPVIKAYGKNLKLCGESCLQRSRTGVFTNPMITRGLKFYHPKLALRLARFRKYTHGSCVYQLILEK